MKILPKDRKEKKSKIIPAMSALLLLAAPIQKEAQAVQMDARRIKPAIEFGWNVGLNTYVTHNSSISSKEGLSLVSLLPRVGFDIIRNYTDRTFFWFGLYGGAPLINVGSSGGTETLGMRFDTTASGGRDVISRERFRLSVLGGVDARYSDFRGQDTASIQSSLSFGAFGWVGIGGTFIINRQHSIFVLGKAGVGGFGVAFGGAGSNSLHPAIGVMGALRVEHSIKIDEKDRAFWFVQAYIPFFSATEGSHPYANSWFNRTSIDVGVGFAFGM